MDHMVFVLHWWQWFIYKCPDHCRLLGSAIMDHGHRNWTAQTWFGGMLIAGNYLKTHTKKTVASFWSEVLVAWFCHPCDMGWREVGGQGIGLVQYRYSEGQSWIRYQDQGVEWQEENPLPSWWLEWRLESCSCSVCARLIYCNLFVWTCDR